MSYVKIWIHAVWGTKNREAILKPAILKSICTHIIANAKEKGIVIDRINGHDDHIHVLMLLNSDLGISKQMQFLKGESSNWANKIRLTKDRLYWADKYFAASVSNDKVGIVRKYIDNQQLHHQKQTFADEYRIFLNSQGFFDEDFG
ncbi:IS200/IS605 family transposase [Dyadobacter sp. CY345]|uniref:IS200/IS605 family transposase n=1 Tax=Dyadobacter sp. CY345 TaxID=2909335 RepID=UPI001F1A7D08|nr:IS200/IS605 family transposase [Dyadobacter sp. CY345]MCF2442976.1 IS200/IS605 family transposase [Dyadobacter sp. CY345]